jgi:hypothetical protein
MLEIKLNEYGVENILDEIRDYLELAIESNSKKKKDEMMYKALGEVEALCYVVDVTKIDVDTEVKEEV